MTETPIRPAATVIVMRDFPKAPKVLMGQRGSKAAFMPNKFVFPGGAVDCDDANVPLATTLGPGCLKRLDEMPDGTSAHALTVATVRELWEETGLILGDQKSWTTDHADWTGFAETGFQPSAKGMFYFFRAVTPPGRSRRFDARFFLIDAAHIQNDLDDFSQASEELSHLQWVPLSQARSLNLPFITAVVLAELSGMKSIGAPDTVPFFKNTDEASLFYRLGGKSPLEG